MQINGITSIPSFTIRWTEPVGAARTRRFELDVDVVGEVTGNVRGHITARTTDNLGRLPWGSDQAQTRILRGADSARAVEQLWKQVKRDRFEQWMPKVDERSGRMDRSDLELVINRGANSQHVYRVDLTAATQPVYDLLDAVTRIHTDVRLHP